MCNVMFGRSRRFGPWSILESWSNAGYPITEFKTVESHRIIKVCEQVETERVLYGSQDFKFRFGMGISRRIAPETREQAAASMRYRKLLGGLFTGRCFYCAKKIEPVDATMDYVIPINLAHNNSSVSSSILCMEVAAALNNVRFACHVCNGRKGIGESRGVNFVRRLYDGTHTVETLGPRFAVVAPALTHVQKPWMDSHRVDIALGRCDRLDFVRQVVADRYAASLLRVTDHRSFVPERTFALWFDITIPSFIVTHSERPGNALLVCRGRISSGAWYARRYRARNRGLTGVQPLIKGRHAVSRQISTSDCSG